MLVPTGVPLKAGDLKKTGQALLRDLLAREAVFDVQFTDRQARVYWRVKWVNSIEILTLWHGFSGLAEQVLGHDLSIVREVLADPSDLD